MMKKSSQFLPILKITAFLLVAVLASSHSYAEGRKTLLLTSGSKDTVSLRGMDSSSVLFVSLKDLAGALKLTGVENTTVGKYEIRLPHHRVKCTKGNPFLVITDLSTNTATVYQLPRSVIAESGLYFVPLETFVSVLQLLWPDHLSYDYDTETLQTGASIASTTFDITGVRIEPKLNGYLLTILATRPLGDVEAWLKPDGEKWLFVTVANARADTSALSRLKPMGAIRQILTFQSPTSVQLTFKVAPDVVSADVVNEPGTDNLMVALHTQSAAEQAELERKRQELIRENLEKDRSRWKLDVIVIDAGHGGKDPGTIGVGKTKEKDITLGIALKLGKLIEKNLKDVRVVYTRKTDKFVELYRRTQIANEAGGKLFVSIHCNSTRRKPSRQNGFEIYLLRPGKTEDAIEIAERENSVIQLEDDKDRYQQLTEDNFILYTLHQSAFMKYSERFAAIAASRMAKHLRIKNSGVKQAGFYVLVGASMPNVLVETGYLSNPKEEKVLRSRSGQERIAEALFNGIKEYKKVYEEGLAQSEPTASDGGSR